MKKAILISGIVVLAVLVFFTLCFFIGVSEDDWICVDGSWVKHGMPSAPMPTEPCGEQIVGEEKDEHGCVIMAGFTWCEAKQKCLRVWEEPCGKEEIFDLLTELRDSTGIKFSGIQDATFEWVVRVDPETVGEIVAGRGFDVERISSGQSDSIHPFFIDNGFKTDVNNFTAGTISESTGYIKGETICTVAKGLTGYEEAESGWVAPETDKWDATVKCGKLAKTEIGYAIEEWKVYANKKYGYSLKYPQPCIYGPLPGYCKQSPPEERSQECLCYFNAEDPDNVSLGTYTGTKPDLVGASFVVFHSVHVDHYSPPAGTDIVSWVKENFPHYDNISDEMNTAVDGMPAIKIYTPFSGTAWSQEDIYFIKDDKVFNIQMLDVDNEDNRALYDKILFTFKISEASEGEAVSEVSKDCAKDGETFAIVSDEHPSSCCEGLKALAPIPDTRLSIADECYDTEPASGSSMGVCIKCGDGVCEDHLNYDENPCNCMEDCMGKDKSHFSSVEEFCQSDDWKMSLSKACGETIKDYSICELCAL
jgi:hypothetical protein